MTDEERRAAAREQAYVAAEISVEGREPRLAVVQDASETGVRLLTHTSIELGDRVEVALQVAAERRIEVAGKVARVDAVEGFGPWRFSVGVALDEANVELGREAAVIREKQTKKS